MRLILHAGTHKTGTTSIQKVLADNREWLRERGLIYPDGKSAFGKTSTPHHRFCRSLNGTDPDGFRKANLFLFGARQHGGPSDTIVISSEAAYKHVYGYSGWDHFSSDDYWSRRERYLKRLADALSAFDVELILFFRERESFAVSLYKEVLTKDYWRGDFQTFLKHFAPWFNYDRQIEAFGHAFPRMRVLLYEDACRNGLIATFFNVIGFPLPPGAETVWERRSAATAPQLANAKVPQLRVTGDMLMSQPKILNRRLLVVTESLGMGETESHLTLTLPRLAACGWSVVTFCLTERGERAQQVEAVGVEVSVAPRRAVRKRSFLRYPAHVALATNKLYWLMRRWRPHIAHFYLPGPYLIGAHVAIAARTPIKIMSRRSLSDYQRNWPLVAKLERRLHTKMDAVIGNSRVVVRQLIEEGIPESKVRLIYNGIEVTPALPDRNEARRTFGLDDDTLLGVVVANLIHYKGHRELISGLSHVEPELPSCWRLLVSGRDHGIRAELEELAAARGISHRIQFLGEYSDIPRLLAAADFGVLTSREEGFSNVILEGMAAGLAMIVTKVGGNPEAVVHGETGLVVPPRDPKAIGDAILRLALDPELRRRLGAAARKRVEEEFSIDKCVRAHADLYEEMLDKSYATKLPTE